MQIAPMTSISKTTIVTPAFTQPIAADVVSPARLFEIARIRLDGALGSLRQPGGVFAPTALATVIALGQVRSGVGALESVLVPSTSFDLRSRAETSIARAREGVAMLRRYHDLVVSNGDRHVLLSDLSETARMTLGEATEQLSAAALALR